MPVDAIEGNVWRFGEHVNTDVIHPPDFFSLDPEIVRKGLFHRYDPELQPKIQPGDIIVAGRNFGCGSSRETSIRSLKLNHIGAIVAVDFARIFFRSATNNGLPCLTPVDPEALGRLAFEGRARLSFDDWTLTGADGSAVALAPVPDFVRRIWSAGGLLQTLPTSKEQ